MSMTLNEEIVLFCAFRYALGRSTYVVESVYETLIEKEKDLPWSFKEGISKEISEYRKKHGDTGGLGGEEAWSYIEWLFDKDRRVSVEAKVFGEDRWAKVSEAVLGADGVIYSLQGYNKYYPTVRRIKKLN